MSRLPKVGLIVACLVGAMFAQLKALGQTIQITTPAENAVMHPGDTITVTVAVSGGSVGNMFIIAEDPLGACQLSALSPYQCSLIIPSDVTAGRYTVTALGVSASGAEIESDPVDVDVESAQIPTAYTVVPSSVDLWPGKPSAVTVVATHPDGSTGDVTKSTTTTYVSQSSAIATVSPDGLITPVSPGRTQVVINGTVIVAVTVEPTVRIVPDSAALAASEIQTFAAQVMSGQNPAVTWSVMPSGLGTIDMNGVYTAPDSITSPQTAIVTATNVADNSQTASATVTLSPVSSLKVSPTWAVVYPAQAQQFTATTANLGTAGVTWTINPTLGVISSTGLYTAPSTIRSLQKITITATSNGNSPISASSTFWISPQPFVISIDSAAGPFIVPQGGSGTQAINELAVDNFPHPVAFSVAGLPTGATASSDRASEPARHAAGI